MNGQITSFLESAANLTDEEIQKLFQVPADAKRLVLLMQIAQSSDDQNRKVDRLVGYIQELAGTVITLLGRLR